MTAISKSKFKGEIMMREFNVNDPQSFCELTSNQQEVLLSWIRDNFISMNTFNVQKTSYHMKHIFEEDNFYVTNGQFKGAMLKAGFRVKNPESDNWYFNVSNRSPAFKMAMDRNRFEGKIISFKDWLKTTDYRVFEKSTLGQLVNDILADDFPVACEKYILFKYLSTLSETQLSIFDKLYDNYIKFISRRFSDEIPEYDSIY